MNSHVCPDGLCRAELDDRVVFRDNRHPTGSFAESLAEELDKNLLESGKERGTSVKTSVHRNSP